MKKILAGLGVLPTIAIIVMVAFPKQKVLANWNTMQGTDAEVWVNGGNGFGSMNTIVRRFSTVYLNVGTCITYTDDTTYGASFLINCPGVYSVSYTDQRTDSAFPYFYYYIDIDHAIPQADVSAIVATNPTSSISSSGPYMIGKNNLTVMLDAGDVVRPWWWGNSGGSYNDQVSQFIITKVR